MADYRGMSLKVIHESTETAMLAAAASEFMRLFEDTIAHKERFDVALSGGSTAKKFFGFLVKTLYGHKDSGQFDFSLAMNAWSR